MKNVLSFISRRFNKIPFSGRIGVIISAVYSVMLVAYQFTDRAPSNKVFAKIINSPILLVWLLAYVALIAVSLWHPIRGATFATCFVGVQGIFSVVQPFDAASLVGVMVWSIFPLLAVHGMIEWFDKRPQFSILDFRGDFEVRDESTKCSQS